MNERGDLLTPCSLPIGLLCRGREERGKGIFFAAAIVSIHCFLCQDNGRSMVNDGMTIHCPCGCIAILCGQTSFEARLIRSKRAPSVEDIGMDIGTGMGGVL
jgi:hypothetical protein